MWNGAVWLAGRDLGLMKLVESTSELEVVKPNIDCTMFDARGDLLMACPAMIASTKDGVAFRGDGMGDFGRSRGAIPSDWENR